jgi:hypothetical protein
VTRLLREGDRISLKVRTAFGWKGDAVVVKDQLSPGGIIAWRRESDDPSGPPSFAMRHEVVLKTHK